MKKLILISLILLSALLTANAQPESTGFTGPGDVCFPQTITLVVVNPVAGRYYRWQRLNTACSSLQQPTQLSIGLSYVATESGAYSFEILDQNFAPIGLASDYRVIRVMLSSGSILPQPISNTGSSLTCHTNPATLCIHNSGLTGPESGGNGFPQPTTIINWYKNGQLFYTGYPCNVTSGGYYKYSVNNGTCTNYSDSVFVTIKPMPSQITAAGPTTFCYGDSVVLNASIQAGVTYKWYRLLNGFYGFTGGTTSSYSAKISGTYYVEVTNSSNCTSASSGVPVSVNLSIPSATITPSGPSIFCTGGSVTLNANTGAAPTYQWKKNGTSISGATSSSYVATISGSYTCTLSNTCGAVTSNSIQVTVSGTVPSTPGTITTTGGAVKVCPGEIRTYSIAAVSGATSYTWTPCAGSTITSGQNTNSVTIQYNANFPTSDSLRVAANNGCGNSAQRKLKISRNTPGTPSAITGTNYGVCNLPGIPYSVTNISGMVYNWTFNTGNATVASGQGTSAITANYGAGFTTGTMSVTAANACGVSTARLKTIYAKPATPASITGSNSVCLNQQDVLYSIVPLANVTNYTWTGPTGSHVSDGNTTSAGTTLVTTAAAVTVDFATTAGTVKVRGNNACASGSYKSLAVAIVCREGDSSPAITEARVFPNPAATDFTIETDDPSVPFDLEIYDALCRLVFSEVNQISSYQVDANGWADGLYSVVIHNGNNMTTLKLVIQEIE